MGVLLLALGLALQRSSFGIQSLALGALGSILLYFAIDMQKNKSSLEVLHLNQDGITYIRTAFFKTFRKEQFINWSSIASVVVSVKKIATGSRQTFSMVDYTVVTCILKENIQINSYFKNFTEFSVKEKDERALCWGFRYPSLSLLEIQELIDSYIPPEPHG
jgi:hypothetical protein